MNAPVSVESSEVKGRQFKNFAGITQRQSVSLPSCSSGFRNSLSAPISSKPLENADIPMYVRPVPDGSLKKDGGLEDTP